MDVQYVLWGLFICGGFILGSIPFSYIIAKLIHKKDICAESDDGNPGAANVFTCCGIRTGILCLVLDMAKSFIPVFAAERVLGCENMLFAIVMLAPVLGHALGIFLGFHGGKCIASAFGETAALLTVTPWGLLLAAYYILLSTVIKIKPNSKRSIVSFGLYGLTAPLLLTVEHKTAVAAGIFLISATAILKHLFCISAEAKAAAAEEPELKHQ